MPDATSIGANELVSQAVGGTTTRYRWDVGWNVLNEEDNLGNLARTHIMDSPLAEVADILSDVAGANPATGAYRYYVSDHLGSTRGLYDDGKSALGGYEYSPYGELYANSGSVALEGLAAAFTGKPWDAAAQMYCFPYRWYSPSAARWLTRDPLGMVDGPNVMQYCGGDPIHSSDPLGLSFISDLLLVGDCLFRAKGLHTAVLSKLFNDKYAHCLTSCFLTLDSGANCAKLAGFLKELNDQARLWNRPTIEDSTEDELANLAGRTIGSSACKYRDCVNGCDKLYPRYW